MAFTYTSPTTSDKDHVRFLTGDVRNDAASCSDAEVLAVLSLNSDDVLDSALACARSIRARIARDSTGRTVNGLTTSRTASELDKVIGDIKEVMGLSRGGIGVFGLTQTDNDLIDDDSDFLQPFAKEGQWVNK